MSDKKPIVTLVGHCGPDSSFLRMAISTAAPGTLVRMADTDADLESAATASDLLLFNRVLEVGFRDSDGVKALRETKAKHPDLPVIMVSNFAETQEKAEEAGAHPGFGKGEIGSDKVKHRLRAALGLND